MDVLFYSGMAYIEQTINSNYDYSYRLLRYLDRQGLRRSPAANNSVFTSIFSFSAQARSAKQPGWARESAIESGADLSSTRRHQVLADRHDENTP